MRMAGGLQLKLARGRFGDGHDVRSLAEKIDLDQVDVAGEHFPLFGPVQFAARTGVLVRRADDFDDGDDLLARLDVADVVLPALQLLGQIDLA